MNTRNRLILSLTLLTASACVRSLDPFCPANAREPRPDLNGTWLETDKAGLPQPGARWVIADGTVTTTNDEEKAGGALNVAFFKAGAAWFADTDPRDMTTGADGWWMMHMAKVHHVCRVESTADQLKITPLDQDWLRARLQESDARVQGIQVAHAGQQLFAGRPAAWVRALGAVASDTNAFPAARTMTLKRMPRPSP